MHYKSRIESVRVNPDTGLVEIEIEDHPFFIVQYHPEYKNGCKPTSYFVNFVAAAVKAKKIISVHQKIVKSNFCLSGNDNQ
jgi:CTP synthase (UTP-ammonia lyase)